MMRRTPPYLYICTGISRTECRRMNKSKKIINFTQTRICSSTNHIKQKRKKSSAAIKSLNTSSVLVRARVVSSLFYCTHYLFYYIYILFYDSILIFSVAPLRNKEQRLMSCENARTIYFLHSSKQFSFCYILKHKKKT